MRASLRRLGRRLRRLARPALGALLVLAQCATAFGVPVVTGGNHPARPCGCPVTGSTRGCCCGPDGCCAMLAAAVPKAKPQAPRCPKCRAEEPGEPAPAPTGNPLAIEWGSVLKARQCHGEGPLGLLPDVPAVPPALPSRTGPEPEPAGDISPANLFATPLASVPDDPPPRR